MKTKKLTAITLMLASAALSAGFGLSLNNVKGVRADEPTATATKTYTYTLSNVFSATNAEVTASDVTDKTTKFVLSDEGSVAMKRSLALEWKTSATQTNYYTVKFVLQDTNFKTLTLSMDADAAWTTADELAKNKITFNNTSGVVSVSVNGVASGVNVTANTEITIGLKKDAENGYGEYNVYLNGAKVGTFTNIGKKSAQYSSTEKSYPLTFTAEVDGENATTSVLLKEVNGQQFNNLQLADGVENKTGDDLKAALKAAEIVDNAAPVLVVNEEIDTFSLGTAYTLDYTVLDVLKSSSLTTKAEFYQWNPEAGNPTADDYNELKSSSTYIMPLNYHVDKAGNVVRANDGVYPDGTLTTTVFSRYQAEYCSIIYKLGDGAFSDVAYDLSWYANTTKKYDDTDYIVFDRAENGAIYTQIALDDTNHTNIFDEAAFNAQLSVFQTQLNKNAQSPKNDSVLIPSLEWFINDNNGYGNLKFTISYKTPTSASASTSSALSASNLKISVSSEGLYEFKVFANDKANNEMKYYDENGELVEVTKSNVWDIKAIPSFQFRIENKELKVYESTTAKPADRRDTEILNTTYTFDDIKVTGATNKQEGYKLFKVDLDMYNKDAQAGYKLSKSALADVTYTALYEQIKGRVATLTKDQIVNGGQFDLYLTGYAELLAKSLGAETDAEISDLAEDIKKSFIEIKEYDSRITEDNAPELWEEYNKYNWIPSAQSFKTVEEGSYLIVADYYESDVYVQRASAYMLVNVEAEADVIQGEKEWLKNNIVSVILFSIAGVMLILIIILLLVKPSDETLDEVEEKANAKLAKVKGTKKKK